MRRPRRAEALFLALDIQHVETCSTLTPNISSTASLISGLVASCTTLNTYWLRCRRAAVLFPIRAAEQHRDEPFLYSCQPSSSSFSRLHRDQHAARARPGSPDPTSRATRALHF